MPVLQDLSFAASMAEVNNRKVNHDELIQAGKEGLFQPAASSILNHSLLVKQYEIPQST